MTAPTEDEVRAWLEGALIVNDMRARMGGDDSGHFYRAALALLDEARKDRERLDWLHAHMCVDGGLSGHYQRWFESPAFDADTFDTTEARDAWTLRAAIDQARGEG